MPRRAPSGISKQMRLRRRAEFLPVQSDGNKRHGRHVLAIARRSEVDAGHVAHGGHAGGDEQREISIV